MLTGIEFHDWSKGSVVVSAVGQECFKCGKECYDTGWMWSGETGQDIWLHITCAQVLSQTLTHDLHTHRKKTGIEPKST